MRTYHRGGFTLIEVMVTIAIVAIIIGVGSRSILSYQWMASETNYSAALQQMYVQKKLISDAPFESFPPLNVRVPQNGKIKLPNKYIIKDSLTITPMDGMGRIARRVPIAHNLYSVDENLGEIQILENNLKGKMVTINYKFLLPDFGETCTIPDGGANPCMIMVMNQPVQKIDKVELVEGNRFTEISYRDYQLDSATGAITFDKKYAGKIVRITYIGGTIQNICSGEFLNENLTPALSPTGLKMIRIRESYNSNHIEIAIMKVKI